MRITAALSANYIQVTSSTGKKASPPNQSNVSEETDRLAEDSANRTHQRPKDRRTVLKTVPDTSPDCLPITRIQKSEDRRQKGRASRRIRVSLSAPQIEAGMHVRGERFAFRASSNNSTDFDPRYSSASRRFARGRSISLRRSAVKFSHAMLERAIPGRAPFGA